MTTLEKIRTELHATAEMHEDGDYYLRDKWVDEIIDKYAEQEPCDDAISREDAIQAVNDVIAYYIPTFRGFQVEIPLKCARAINELPPVTQKSETITEFADRCRECGAKYGKLLKQEPCDDVVSRQAVLEKAIDVPIAKVMTDELLEYCKVIYHKVVFVNDIEKLPPVRPQEQTKKESK